MKLRTVSNSIRLRLRKSEVEKFQQTGSIEEQVSFPGSQTLTYCLRMNKDSDAIGATFENGSIEIHIPELTADEWMKTDQVSMESFLTLQENDKLHILIEKDFPCKDRPDEDKSDTFIELSPESKTHC